MSAPHEIKVAKGDVRPALGLMQQSAAVRDWEQGRCQPEAAARVLLLVIARNPEVVDEAIRASEPVAA